MYKFMASWCFVLLRLRRPITQASQDSPNLLKKMNNYVWVPRGCNLETVSAGFAEPGLATRYWPHSLVPSLYGKFRTKCLPYMEGSELSAFLIWKVQSSVPSWYGRFRAQCLPYMEGSELSAFFHIDPFLCNLVAMVLISQVKLRRPGSQFQAKLSALLQVVVHFRYNV